MNTTRAQQLLRWATLPEKLRQKVGDAVILSERVAASPSKTVDWAKAYVPTNVAL